jgi:hypothetical protein
MEVREHANFCSRAPGTRADARQRTPTRTATTRGGLKRRASGGQGEPPEALEKRAGEGRQTEGSVSSQGACAPPASVSRVARGLGGSNSPTCCTHRNAVPCARFHLSNDAATTRRPAPSRPCRSTVRNGRLFIDPRTARADGQCRSLEDVAPTADFFPNGLSRSQTH